MERKKIAKLFICGLVFVCLIAIIVITSFNNRTAPHIYIALGDSVSSGYGLPGYIDSPEGSHSSVFFEKLEQRGLVDEYHNMATSGFTTTMLLEMLNNMDDDGLRLFQNARVITLNIGGNNILIPFMDYVSGLQVLTGVDGIRTGVSEVLSEALGAIAENDFRIGNVITRIGNIVSGIGGLIAGAEEIIGGYSNIISIWRGLFSPELETLLEEGILIFTKEFSEIITWLQANAPSATLIVNTVYNPIPQEMLRFSIPVSNWANALIESMNYIILRESESRGYLVVDVHYYFLNRLYLTSFNLNPFSGAFSFDLVHPNAQGHSLIAELHYASFLGYISSE